VNRCAELQDRGWFEEIDLLHVSEIVSVGAVLPGLHLRKRNVRFAGGKLLIRSLLILHCKIVLSKISLVYLLFLETAL